MLDQDFRIIIIQNEMDDITRRAQRAIYELDLRVDQKSSYDNLELAQILVGILDYPDLVHAHNHESANKMGNYDLIQVNQELAQRLDHTHSQKPIDRNSICECCGLFIHDESIPFCTPLEDINIGLGTRLYFNSILYNIAIFIVVTVLFSLYFLVTNIQACVKDSIISCGIDGLSLSYKIRSAIEYENYLRTSSILGIVLVCIWGVLQVVKNHHEKKIAIELTSKFIRASEFTLMLERFPLNMLKASYQQNLEMIQKLFSDYQKSIQTPHEYKVVKVNIARNLYVERKLNRERIQELNQKLKEKQKQFKQWIVQRKYHNRFFTSAKEREEKYKEYQEFYVTEYDVEEVYEGQEDESVIVFVTFESSKVKDEIEQACQPANLFNFFNLLRKEKFPIEGVRIKKAPPPEEMKWTNIGFPLEKKIKRGILVYGVALLFLAGSLGMTYGLNQVANNTSDIWVSILISIVITSINFGLQFAIMILSKYLNQPTQSTIQFNIAFKICLFEILNSIGVPLLAIYISKRSLYGDHGLSQDIFFIALFNILPPIGRFIDPFYIMIRIRNKIYERPYYRLDNYQSQKQFNKIYEDNEFDLGYEYAYIIKTSIFTSFFMSIQPIIALFAVVGFIFMYEVNKYRLLYRFYKPRYYSSTVNVLVNYLLNLSPMIFGLGMLIWTNWQSDYHLSNTLILNWVIFAIGGFFLFFPFRILYKCINEPLFPDLSYSKNRPILPSEYDRMNPSTRSQAIEEHRSYLRQLEAKMQLPRQALLLNQSFMRDNNQSMMRSRVGGFDELRMTIRNMRQSMNVEDHEYDKLATMGEKPFYNSHMESYDKFVRHEQKNKSKPQI